MRNDIPTMSITRTRILPWIVCGLAALFYCYEYLLRIMPSIMSEHLLHLFNLNGLAFGHLVAIYYYAYIPMQLPVGILMDRISPRKLLIFACLICGLGAYGFAQPHLLLAQTGRFLVGLGSAFAFIGVMKLATLWLPLRYFGLIAGLATSLGMVGAMVGDIVLSKLVMLLGNYSTLQAAGTLGIVLTVIIWLTIPEKNPCPPAQLASLQTLPSFKVFYTQVRALLKNPQMWLLGLVGCLFFLSLTAFAEMWAIPYLIRNYHLSTQIAANYNAFVFLGWAVGGPLMGSIAGKLGPGRRVQLMLVSALIGAIIISIVLYLPEYAKPCLGSLLFFFGVFSAAQVIIFSIVRELNKPATLGTAFAVTNCLVMLGGGIAQPMIGYLLDTLSLAPIKGNLMAFSTQSFTWALTILPIGCLLAALLSCFIKDALPEESHSIS